MEYNLLKSFENKCLEKGLYYDDIDRYNFHTAIKTGGLVILSGMSGTGKSAIVNAYAKAFNKEDNFLAIPVRPSWTDDTDLLGYLDVEKSVFRPSDTGLVEFLIKAQNDKENLYFVNFDEMNLAKVEHYFSQFLSILERPLEERELRIYNETYTVHNSSTYPEKIKLGENIRFIGTVNIDESTYHFSDKVLDRANVISLNLLNYSKLEKIDISDNEEFDEVITMDDFSKFIISDSEIRNIKVLRDFLWELHTRLNKTNPELGIGPRVVLSIEKYLYNYVYIDNDDDEIYSVISIEDADNTDIFDSFFIKILDLQLKQRVFTKLRGQKSKFGDLFSNELEEDSEGFSILEMLEDISLDFKESFDIINKKQKDLNDYGYTS